jgi:ribosomal protein L40E
MSELKSVFKICRRCNQENLCKPTARTCNKCFTVKNNEKLKARNYFNENSKKYYKYTPIPKDEQQKRGRKPELNGINISE